MQAAAVLSLLGLWLALGLRVAGAWRGLVCAAAGLLGVVYTLAGGFAFWWDAHMQPGQKSAVVLVCGVLMLGTVAVVVFREWIAGEMR